MSRKQVWVVNLMVAACCNSSTELVGYLTNADCAAMIVISSQ